MSKQKKSSGALPRNINLVTPVPRPDAQRITRLVKNSGRVEGYELSNGEILTKREGVALAKAGGIRGVAVAVRNRWRRQQLDPALRDEIAPKNIILMGPTGVGKTEIAR